MSNLQQPDTDGRQPTFLLHGVFAVRDDVEGYSLVEVQQGIVTAVESESITVTSPDGFVQSYSLGAERADQLVGAVGSRVTVMVDPEGHAMVELGESPADGSEDAVFVPVSRSDENGATAPFDLDMPLQLPSTLLAGGSAGCTPRSSTAAR